MRGEGLQVTVTQTHTHTVRIEYEFGSAAGAVWLRPLCSSLNSAPSVGGAYEIKHFGDKNASQVKV